MFGQTLSSIAMGVICLSAAAFQVSGQGCSIRQRQEIRTLSSQQRTAFIGAIRQLQSGTAPTRYDAFSDIHYQARTAAHGNPQFLAWHRWFIREFEKALQSIDSSIMLPFWDWSYDSQLPATSPIFGADWFGGNGNAQNDYCLSDGAFASYRPYYPTPHCLRRRFDQGSQVSAFTSPEVLTYLKRSSTDYNAFRTALEGTPHAQVHNLLGFGGTDMSTMNSPNDPIFWLHHAFIDKLWADWQASNPSYAQSYGGTNQDGTPTHLTDKLFYYSATVSDTMDIRQFCYTYAPFGGQPRLARRTEGNGASATDSSQKEQDKSVNAYGDNTPVDDDATEIVALRTCQPVPEDWLQMNNLNVTEVRHNEAKHRTVVDKLNADVTYVSPVCLLQRHDVLVKIVTLAKKLRCSNGKRSMSIDMTQKKEISVIVAIAEVVKKARDFLGQATVGTIDYFKDEWSP